MAKAIIIKIEMKPRHVILRDRRINKIWVPFVEENSLIIKKLIDDDLTSKEISFLICGKYKDEFTSAMKKKFGRNTAYFRLKKKTCPIANKDMLNDLRVMTYEEVSKKYNLKHSTICLIRRKAIEKNIPVVRKDDRNLSCFTLKEFNTMVKDVQNIPLEKISIKLKRGKDRGAIRERIEKMGIRTRTNQGISKGLFIKLFGDDQCGMLDLLVFESRKEKNGSGKYIPWHCCVSFLKHYGDILEGGLFKKDDAIRIAEIFSMFLEWNFRQKKIRDIQLSPRLGHFNNANRSRSC